MSAASVPKIYLIRHGATEWSVAGKHTGRSDLPLTPEGEQEALRLKARLEDIKPKVVYSSPLQRARKTAELVGFTDIRVEPNLAEWHYGEFEGLKTKEILEKHPGWMLFDDGCPGGESVEDVERRAHAVIGRVRADNCDAALVAHGHMLRVIAACWLGLPAREGRFFLLGTASLSLLTYEHGSLEERVIKLWNEQPL